MKIALVSRPWIKIPPEGHGGVEEVVHQLTEGLIRKGHQVSLYATGDSTTNANLSYYYNHSLGNDKHLKSNPFNMLNHLDYFYNEINKKTHFDIIHDHAGSFSLYFLSSCQNPFLITCHLPLIISDDPLDERRRMLLKRYKNFPYVSISNYQRTGFPDLNYLATIYNGVKTHKLVYSQEGGNDIVWLGRIIAHKGLDIAIDIAHKLEKKILIRGSVDKGEIESFQQKIIKTIGQEAENIKEVHGDREKAEFLGQGKLFLYSPRWEEPFGIVMIESMACGTPVVAFARGAVPEIIKDGETGFIVNPSETDIRGNWIVKKTGIDGLCEAVERTYSMSKDQYIKMRQACRDHVGKNFTVEKVVDEYEKVYKEVINKHKSFLK